jgi:hypothetical protein
MLLSSTLLLGCTQAAPGKDSPSLRIVMRMHPDPQQMRTQLEERLSSCMLQLRAKGQQAQPPALPKAADIARWVTRETEELYADGRRASYQADTVVWPNADKACQWTFYKTVHAETETLCGDWYGGSAKAEPGPDAATEPPSFNAESTPASDVKRCLAEAARPESANGLPKGVTPGGRPCLWLSDGPVAAGATEPQAPGQYFCSHPRAYDGSLPRYRRSAGPTLRYLRVPAPGAPRGPTPEVDADRMEAEVVEEGQPIPASRFSRQAVEAFVKQPLVAPLGGQQ